MHKCDGCGKMVVNEQDYMCPHCGAVSRKKCDHTTHLPDDKYFRANDYRTAASEHKSKTYTYQKAPKTGGSEKFDINDLANIKNAEDAKRIAKKAFIEQGSNGKKKFKPLAIVLIVIFAINIFGNVLDIADEAIDGAFDGFEEVFSVEFTEDDFSYEDLYGVSEIENSVYTDYDTVYSYIACANVENAAMDNWNDVLEIHLSGMGFNKMSIDIENDDDFSYQTLVNDSVVVLYDVEFITSDAIEEFSLSADETDALSNYTEHAKFKGYLSEDGVFSIEGVPSKLDEYSENVFVKIENITVLTESASGIDCYKGECIITPDILRCDSFGECNFYEYYDIADETFAHEHFEMITLPQEGGFDLQDVSEYSQVVIY